MVVVVVVVVMVVMVVMVVVVVKVVVVRSRVAKGESWCAGAVKDDCVT